MNLYILVYPPQWYAKLIHKVTIYSLYMQCYTYIIVYLSIDIYDCTIIVILFFLFSTPLIIFVTYALLLLLISRCDLVWSVSICTVVSFFLGSFGNLSLLLENYWKLLAHALQIIYLWPYSVGFSILLHAVPAFRLAPCQKLPPFWSDILSFYWYHFPAVVSIFLRFFSVIFS